MDKLDAMRMFVRVVERRSFAKAAHDLALPRSRISEAVQQLEQRLGVRLLTRTTRHVEPTAEGREYQERCASILAQIDSADAAVSDAVPTGALRIDVHGTFTRHFLFPHLLEFVALHPRITVHISENDRLVDLVSEGIDCVIRVGEQSDSGLVGRRLGMLEEGTFASPTYIQTYGSPSSLDDLAGHHVIGFVSSKTRLVIPLEFQTPDGLKLISAPAKVTATSSDAMACLAIHGLGIIQVPRYRVLDELRSGQLVEVLSAFAPSPSPVHILHPEGRYLSSRARAFIDWASDKLSRQLNARIVVDRLKTLRAPQSMLDGLKSSEVMDPIGRGVPLE
jgi:DNA-binding transcriptional LysR family regulator